MKGTKHIYMKYYSKKQWTQKLTVMVLLSMALGGTAVQAMPSGADIRSGQGSISQDGKNMTVQQNSQRMAIDWTKFDIAKDETVRYAQPDRNAISLNRVTGGQQSVIAGNLNANGNVILVNPNGVVFTKNSSVDVGGLVASTARLNDEAMKNFSNGKDSLGLSLDKNSTASVINEGQIKAQGGLVALHAANVENKGTITNEGGTLAMAAAKNLTLSAADDDKLNFTVDGELAKSQALNSGSLKADGGYVVMTAKSAGDVLSTVVNNTGTIEAKTLRKNEKGQILLDGGESGQVEVSGTLDASGTEEGQSAGSIKVIGEKTIVHDGTNLLARGAIDGGKIETSGDVLNLGDNLNIDAKGVNGKAGEWLLDPLEVLIQDEQPIQAAGDQSLPTVNEGKETQITYNDPPSATQNADATYSSTTWIKTSKITDILKAGTDVTIQAASTSQAASITVNSAINPKVEGDREATLTLEAQRNITINQEIAADKDGGKLNVKLNSDTDGDGVGAVIINADISTNGGTFTSGSGGTVKFDATQKDTKGNTIYENKVDAFGNKVPKYLTAGYSSGGTYSGTANIQGNTVGTYFGYVTPAGKTVTEVSENRTITTNGGDINLYGEVAIGLNGGILNLDTSKTAGTGGALNITGIINSGNSYTDYIYGTDAWNKLVSTLVDEYIAAGTVPSYHFVGIYYTKNADGTYSYTTTPHDFKKGETHYAHYAFHEFQSGDVVGSNWTYNTTDGTLDTQDTRWYTTTTAGKGYNSFIMEATTPTTSKMSIDDWLIYYRRTDPSNYATKYADGNTNTKTNLVNYAQIKDNETKMANLKSDISALLAHNWYASEALAKSGTGANPGDSYLATITTALENSLSTPNSQKTLWVGGMGSGVQNKTNDNIRIFTHTPADPTHPDGFYWVTGPEGLVTNALTYTKSDGTTVPVQGTKFWDTSSSDWTKNNYGSQVYGYTKWSSWSGGGQPDNSAPFLTVGYGNNNAWDDASVGGESTVGFVQETNLYNSSLNIKTSGGAVTLQGDIGKSVGLDTVKIDAGSGSVTTGNTQNTATKYNHGTIYADHGVYINGGEVTVGGEIHSGGTDVEATRNTDSSFSDYLDNVTINSAGNIEVHGITSNTYDAANDDGTTTTRGGKISLTSTGDKGKITLGAGVDYNGKATEGTLVAASTAKGAVVIDAQGSQGSLVNSTTGTSAITTGEKGTWQVYVNSPSDYGTSLGDNLNSATNAQWTARSDTNAAVTTNSSGNTLTDYNDTSSNKFIFQVTPVITISGGSQQKTYGDKLSDDQLRDLLSTSATYTDSTGKDVDVTQFSNFKEADYLNYVTSSDGTKTGTDAVAVSSDGAAAGATRTNGDEDKAASDGKKAFYVFKVEEDGAKALNGYDLKTVNGDIEILRKTLTINTSGIQTYGNATVTSGTPETDSTQLMNGDTLDTGSISYKIATDGKYADSKGSNDTAHVGSYENQYLTTGATVKASDGSDASANYAVTGSGTITVNPANLYLTVGDVSTTYGTAFDDTQYGYTVDSTKGGLVNGDTQDAVLGEKFLNYTNTGNATDPVKIANGALTQNAGTYELQGVASKDLSDYTVHITNGKSSVEKAKLTLTVGNTETTYGTAFDPNTYSYTLSGNTNGDTAEGVEHNKITVVTYTNGGEKSDAANDKVKTQNVGSYDLTGTFTLSGDTAQNYEIGTVKAGKAEVTPAEIHLKLNDVSTTYGTAFDTGKYGYDASKLEMANGDSTEVVTTAIGNGNITYTNTGDATDPDNENVKTQNAGTGYKLTGTTEKTLQNYKVVIDGADSTVEKADLTLTLKDVSTTYGNEFDGKTYGYKKDAADLQGLTNGDAATAITDVLQDSDFTYGNGGAKSDPNNENVKTQNAGSYQITGSTSKNLDNYNIKVVKPGTSIVEKAKLTLKVGDTETTYGTAFAPNTYSYTLAGNTNGDSEDNVRNNQIEVSYSNGGEKSDPNNSAIKTQNVGDYDLKGTFNLKGDTAKNYEIDEVNSDLTGTAKVNKATVKVKLNDVSTTYGTAFDTSKYGYDTSSIEGLTNGDGSGVVTSALDGTYGKGNITYTNTGDASAEEKQAGKVTKTVNGGPYYLEGTTDKTLKNYNIEIENGNATIKKATLHLSTGDYTETYGDVGAVQKDLGATTVTGEKNGDSLADLVPEIDIHNTSKALLSDTRTNDVKYKADGSLDSYSIITDFNKSLDNYNVEQDKTGSVTLKPKEITIKNTMTQQYGSSDRTYKEATVPEGQLANGDKISTKDLKFDIKADGEYAKSLAENKKNNSEAVTADVGTYTGELIHTGGGITHADGSDAYKNYKVTVEGDIVVTRAPLTITTEDVTTEYGTVKNTTSKVTGLVNGDQNYASDISYDYGDYGHGYLDDNTRTNNVGSYDITTNTTNTTSDFLKNYTISGGNAKLTITPKDVYFHVDGKGSTFDDIVYTVTDPNHPGNRDAINSQLLYGETVTGGYGIGQALPDTPGSKEHYYTVDSTINGTPVYDNNGQGTQVGNYVYHPTGQAVIHFDQPQKPDQTTHYVEGAHRPQDKLESALPVFRVDASGVVKQYGTYGIESQSQAVTLSPTGMRMPEPNQTSTQDRKYLTTLKTAHGHGTFRLEYNGVVLRVIPVDPAAEQIVEAGDKLKNVALSEQALHVAYTQMGLDLVNLKGVYIYMAPM